MTKGKTIVLERDILKGNITSNCRLITKIPMVLKILTAQKREEINHSLVCREQYPKELKGYESGQIDNWNRRSTRYRSAHFYRDQNKTEKCNHGMDKLKMPLICSHKYR